MLNKCKQLFQKHPEQSNCSYFQHMKWAVFSGFKMISAGFASIIHGIFPFLFEFYSAKTIIDLYWQRSLENHPNEKYRQYVKRVKSKHESLSC